MDDAWLDSGLRTKIKSFKNIFSQWRTFEYGLFQYQSESSQETDDKLKRILKHEAFSDKTIERRRQD